MPRVFQIRALLVVASLASAVCVGCGKPGNGADPTATAESQQEATKTHDHSGWWCPEHGVPEEVCTRCNSTLISGFVEKEDWCDTHDRPDSQCFHCHPELEAEFAARYEAKYGKQPPVPTDP
jgi:hypothetical protein